MLGCLRKNTEHCEDRQDIGAVWKVYQDMACGDQKKLCEENGLLQKAKVDHIALSELCMAPYLERSETLKRVRSQRLSSHSLVLASCPEVGDPSVPVLTIAAWAIQEVAGVNIAGDADDKFHKMLMTEAEMKENVKGWRTAWKGKLEGILLGIGSTNKVTLFSSTGGTETQWERGYLLNDLRNAHLGQSIDVECCHDLRRFLNCLEQY